jgi:hypothetical protein
MHVLNRNLLVHSRMHANSLSILTWELATQTVPFLDVPLEDFNRRVTLGKERPVLDPTWPHAFCEALTRGWSHEAAARPDIIEMQALLLQVSATSCGAAASVDHLVTSKNSACTQLTACCCSVWLCKLCFRASFTIHFVHVQYAYA